MILHTAKVSFVITWKLLLFLQSAKLDSGDDRAKSTVSQALDKMAAVLSHKQANSSALAAVIEIRLETAASEADEEGKNANFCIIKELGGEDEAISDP